MMLPSVKKGRRRLAGFTMIELLLVVLIAGLVVGLAVPRFVGSYKGARLRNSVRTVVRLHRYARSSAVLEQREGALLFDVVKGTITLIVIPKDQEASGFLDETPRDSFFGGEDSSAEPEENEGPVIEERIERMLEDGIKIVDIEVGVEGQEIDGIHWVNYFPNGMCDPYALRLIDPDGENSVRITVDSVSGQVEVDYE